MGVSKVNYGGRVLIDLTSDTVTEDKLLSGITAHNKAGNLITGTLVNQTPKALITVDYPENSTCTCSPAPIGALDITATKKLFAVAGIGTYTITATNGTDTNHTTVVVTADGQGLYATIVYGLYLVHDGIPTVDWTNIGKYYNNSSNFQYSHALTVTPVAEGSLFETVAQMEATGSAPSRRYGGVYYTTNEIDTSNYSTLKVKLKRTIMSGTARMMIGFYDNDATRYANTCFSSASIEYSGSAISDTEPIVLPIPFTASDHKRVAFAMAAGGAPITSNYSSADIYDVWLE